MISRTEFTLPLAEALQGYVLVSAQVESGGLRDKPGKSPDAYHTLYNLSGLSSAQHHVYRPAETKGKLESEWIPNSRSIDLGGESTKKDKDEETRKAAFLASLAWTEEEGASRYVGGRPNRVVSFVMSILDCSYLTLHFDLLFRMRPIPCLT